MMTLKNDQDAYPDPWEKSRWFIFHWIIPGLIFLGMTLLGVHYYCSAIIGSHPF